MSILTWIKWGAILGAVAYAYYAGYNYESLKATAAMAAYVEKSQATINQLQIDNLGINNNVITKYVNRVQTVTKVVHDTQTVIKYVPEANTVLSLGLINVYNDSVLGITPNQSDASNKTLSGVDVNEALGVAVDNNGTCLAYKNEIEAWQNWYNQEQAVITQVNKAK